MNTAPERVAELRRVPLPDWPQGWYVVARSSDLPPRGVCTTNIAGHEIVVFRTASGVLGALDAHCPHMGAHLGRGRVDGEHLECALHCWRLTAEGAVAGREKRTRAWPVREHSGLVMLEVGHGGRIPEAGGEDFDWTRGTLLDIATQWHGLVANGFDMVHLCTVHHRDLVEPPKVAVEPGWRCSLHYISRVRGHEWSDRLMRWLSRDRIDVRVHCYGAITTVETDLGFTRTSAFIGMTPNGEGTKLFVSFGVRRGPFRRLRVALTRALFTAFLKRDLGVVEGMKLRTDVDDPILQALFDFLRTLRPVRE